VIHRHTWRYVGLNEVSEACFWCRDCGVLQDGRSKILHRGLVQTLRGPEPKTETALVPVRGKRGAS